MYPRAQLVKNPVYTHHDFGPAPGVADVSNLRVLENYTFLTLELLGEKVNVHAAFAALILNGFSNTSIEDYRDRWEAGRSASSVPRG